MYKYKVKVLYQVISVFRQHYLYISKANALLHDTNVLLEVRFNDRLVVYGSDDAYTLFEQLY